MKRVCKPGGLVAARDGDYGAFRWYPDEPAIDRWLALYRTIARRNAGEPDAGRFLLAWAHAAGFDDVLPGASVWCFATPDDRAWWGGLWADRMTDSAIARQAVTEGLATEKELREIAEGWRRWADAPRCLVRRPPRRDPLPRLGPCRSGTINSLPVHGTALVRVAPHR